MANPLQAGQVFGDRYEIARCIATGGMGAVYEVVDRRTRRRRALKVMLPDLVGDADLRVRFEQEARVTADVQTEHIVETFDAGIDAETGSPFLVMELLRGEGLDALLERRGRLPSIEVVMLLTQAARALDRTLEAGIVHRDLKPSNIFLTRRDDGGPRVKLLDFGIAKLVAQSTESMKTTRSVGTPVFMAPEQIRGAATIDGRADVYALAHIAYTLLVGEPYWETEARGAGNVYGLLLRIAQGGSESASKRAASHDVRLPRGFDAWFARGTAVEPRDRFERAGELVHALAAVLEINEERAPTEPTGALPPTPMHRSRAAVLVTVIAGGVLAVALGGAGRMLRSRANSDVQRAPSAAFLAPSGPPSVLPFAVAPTSDALSSTPSTFAAVPSARSIPLGSRPAAIMATARAPSAVSAPSGAATSPPREPPLAPAHEDDPTDTR